MFFDGRWKLFLTTLGAFEEDACVRVLPRTPAFNVGGALQGDMQLRTFPSTTLNLGGGEGGSSPPSSSPPQISCHAWSILNSIHGPHEGSVSPRNSSLLSFRPSLAPFPLHFILPSTVLPFLSSPFLYIDSWIRGFLDFWVPAFPHVWNPGLHLHKENTEQARSRIPS